MSTTIETYQRIFWNLNEELADLIKTKQLISFLKKWNTTVKQVVKIHEKLDDVKIFIENSQIE
jgi:ribosomal protein L4